MFGRGTSAARSKFDKKAVSCGDKEKKKKVSCYCYPQPKIVLSLSSIHQCCG